MDFSFLEYYLKSVTVPLCLVIMEVLNFFLFSWYHDNLKRDMAEDMLKRVRKNGAFLVRKKETDQPTADQSEFGNQSEIQNDELSYAISFRSVVKGFLISVC